MPKICMAENCKRCAFGGGYCILPYHQALRTDAAYLRKLETKKSKAAEKKQKPVKEKKFYQIPKASKKLAKNNAIYARELPEWKGQNSVCCFPGCDAPTAHCHHAKGRGRYLLEKSTWRPLCQYHHDQVENHANNAKKLNLSVSRLTTLEKDVELFESGFYE